MASDEERREIAEKMRKGGIFECADLAKALGNGCKVGVRCDDCRDWMGAKLASLIEPQCDTAELARIADGLDTIDDTSDMAACRYFGVEDGDCLVCRAYQSNESCDYLAAHDAARRIRAALGIEKSASESQGDVSEVEFRNINLDTFHLVDKENFDAAEWVREHGGLESVKDGWNEAVNLCATIGCEPDGTVTSMLEAAGECTDIVMKRLMPEGMEWPHYEDRKPVLIGDRVCDMDVRSIIFESDKTIVSNCTSVSAWGKFVLSKGPFKRFVPKAPDADGVETRSGDTVWSIEGDGPFKVAFLNGTVAAVDWTDGSAAPNMLCSCLTHRAPVFAADGKPLHEGETVWLNEMGLKSKLVDRGEPLKVVAFDKKGNVGVLDRDDIVLRETSPWWFSPSCLTHERPDSWELLEADCSMNTGVYARERMGIDVGKVPAKESRRIDMIRDLVRRAKALAGVSE